MTNPPQEPGESSPEPKESGEATSDQESAVSDTSPDSDPTEQVDTSELPESADSEDSADEEPKESVPEATAVDGEPAPPVPADQPPPKSRKGRIAAIVLVVALVLAGGGVAVYLVTKGDQGKSGDRAGSGASSTKTTSSRESETESESGDVYDDYYDDYGSSTESSESSGESGYPEYDDYDDSYGETSGEDEPEREIRDIDDGSFTSDDPDEVRLAYMAAYENKEFSDIVENSCDAYQDRFGTDTQELEDALADYDVIATEDGDLDVEGRTATGRIDIELSADDNTDSRKILVKLVEERGKWRFCGEDEG